MLEAYLVIPAFGLVYLWSAPGRLRRRIGHLTLAAGALLAVSLSWAVAVDLTPASLRPYVGSSGTNSELNLALGYNGLSRLLGGSGTPGGGRGGNTALTQWITTHGTVVPASRYETRSTSTTSGGGRRPSTTSAVPLKAHSARSAAGGRDDACDRAMRG